MKKAIGLIELKNIAKGILVTDTMLKSGNVELLTAQPFCPGKYIVMVSGNIGAVESAVQSGCAVGDEAVVDQIVLPNIHPSIFSAITGCTDIKEIRALGVIEVYTAVSAILAADTAVKSASVELLEIRMAKGLGGKAVILLTGDVGAVNTAVDIGCKYIENSGYVVDNLVLPSPHIELHRVLY